MIVNKLSEDNEPLLTEFILLFLDWQTFRTKL